MRLTGKTKAADSAAYVLSQTAGPDGELRWHIVDRSGPMRTFVGQGPAPDRHDESTPAAALAAMRDSANARQRVAERIAADAELVEAQRIAELPDDATEEQRASRLTPRHSLFIDVPAAELPDYGVVLFK